MTKYFDNKQQAREQSKLVDADELRLAGGQTGMETQESYLKNLVNFNVSKYGDTAGLANAGVTLETQLGEGGRLSGLSEEDKTSLRTELANAGATPQKVLDNILLSGGKDVLAQLLGGSAGVPASVMTKDAKTGESVIDSTKLNAEVLKRVTEDPYFLANVATAMQDEAFIRPKQMPGKDMNELFNPTTTTPGTVTGGVASVPPASVVAPSYVTTNITASVLDKATIQQIEAAIAKGLRDAKERGATASIPLAPRR